MYYKCCVPNCTSSRKDTKLHKFPSNNPERLKKWVDSIPDESLKSKRPYEINSMQVCHRHFEARFLTINSGLKFSAYPTLFLEYEMTSGCPGSVALEDNISNRKNTYHADYTYHADHTYHRLVPLPISRETHTDQRASNDSVCFDHSYSTRLDKPVPGAPLPVPPSPPTVDINLINVKEEFNKKLSSQQIIEAQPIATSIKDINLKVPQVEENCQLMDKQSIVPPIKDINLMVPKVENCQDTDVKPYIPPTTEYINLMAPQVQNCQAEAAQPSVQSPDDINVTVPQYGMIWKVVGAPPIVPSMEDVNLKAQQVEENCQLMDVPPTEDITVMVPKVENCQDTDVKPYIPPTTEYINLMAPQVQNCQAEAAQPSVQSPEDINVTVPQYGMIWKVVDTQPCQPYVLSTVDVNVIKVKETFQEIMDAQPFVSPSEYINLMAPPINENWQLMDEQPTPFLSPVPSPVSNVKKIQGGKSKKIIAKKLPSFKQRSKKKPKKKIKSFDDVIKGMSPLAKQFFAMQVRMSKKKRARGRRFTEEDKLLALSLFKHGLKSYRFLQTMFILPSTKTMKNYIKAMGN